MAADLQEVIASVMMALVYLKKHLFLMMYRLWWLSAEAFRLKV